MTDQPKVSTDDFCAYCFAPLGLAWHEARKRRYCDRAHAEADLKARADLSEFQTELEPAAGQDALW